jgi:hypothetical protein
MSVTFNKNFASIEQAELIWTQDGIFEGPIVFLSEKHTSLISWLFSEYKILISLQCRVYMFYFNLIFLFFLP